MTYRAVIFDLGGVVFPSPFEAFDQYEHGNNLSKGSMRSLIRYSSEQGAWAALERGEITMDEFATALEAEAAAAGFGLDARRLMGLIGAHLGPRPEMIDAIHRIRARGIKTAALTNNWSDNDRSTPDGLHDQLTFDVVVESSRERMRKPDPRIYALTIARLNVLASEVIFLDDLGMNLKPAREMGMATIKVTDPDDALAELEAILGFAVR